MPISTVDPRPALVLIDLQEGLRNVPAEPPVSSAIAHAAELAKAFRQHQFPVVLVNATGQAPGRTERRRSPGPAAEPPANFADLVGELDAQTGDIRVTKQTWGAFQNTDLHARLQELGVTQVVIGGVATSLGVESTARSAYEHGYHVVLATDAMTDPDPVSHAHAIERIFPRLGETGKADEILDLIGR